MCTTRGQHINLQQPRTRTTLVWACMWVWASLCVGVRGGCPEMCECFWRDSKETAACREADFIDIPRGLEPTTQVLDLSHNNLRILPRDAFVYTGLTTLQKVVLSHCKLFLLEAGSFKSVENVMELDLSHNRLTRVPSAALKGLVMLRELSLAYNTITTLASTAFTHIPHIVQLVLNNNGLTSVAVGSLRNLTELELLSVADNKLSHFPAGELGGMNLLRVIRVDGNPWHCNCHLRPLRQWFLDRNLAASVPPSCSFPKWLAGQDWQLIGRDDLLCAPKVAAIAPRVLAAHGENVSLLCRIETEVETTITWLVGDTPLFNDSDMTRYLVVDLVTANNISFVSNLTIIDVVTEDQGTYRCVAEDRAGVREANFTLQVSHEVAEVRVATITVSYMKEGLLGGMSVLILVLVLVCSVIYCKVRVGRVPRREEDSIDTAQSSRGSECEAQHKLAGYHVIPTNDTDDSSPHRQQQLQDAAWGVREAGAEDQQGVVVAEGANATLSSSTLPFLDGAQGDPFVAREAAQLVVRHNEMFPHLVCNRSVSQVSLTNGNHYPDLLDLPPAPLQHHVSLQDHHGGAAQGLSPLSPAACIRNFLPCRRTYSDAGCLAGVGVGRGGMEGVISQDLQPLTHHNPNYSSQDHQDSSRSSSALNLALSQAASNAYANAHLAAAAAGGSDPAHACLGAASLLDHHGERSESGEGGCNQHHHPADPCHFEYHAAQLEKFLKEYRCLQEQLNHMKQSYEAHKRAGSMPRLDCCPQGDAGHRSSTVTFPDGTAPCCSCNHSPAQPHSVEFAETSLADTAGKSDYPEVSMSPLPAMGGYLDPTQAQAGITGDPHNLEAATLQVGGYTAKPSPFIENSNSLVPEMVEGLKFQPVEVRGSSPITSNSANTSPKTKTSKTSKEPLKSILKKSPNGTGVGGRWRGNQWPRGTSCCNTQPTSHGPTPEASDPAADLYPMATEPSYQLAESHKTDGDALLKMVDPMASPSGVAHTTFDS